MFAAYQWTFLNIAVSGWATFPNLVNKADLNNAQLLIIDQSNDDSGDLPECEAWIRKASAAGQRVIEILNPSWSIVDNGQVNTPTNQATIELMRTLLNAYDVPYIDGWIICQAHVAGGGNLSDLFTDTAHWSAAGHAVIEAALDDYLPDRGTIRTPLPARIHAASADFENTPTQKNGTDYDSRTGIWTDNGTSTSSSQVGATITFSFTGRKFGIFRASGSYPTVTVVIDGGAPIINFALYDNGYDIGARAAHTVVVTVTSAIQIDEFWAI